MAATSGEAWEPEDGFSASLPCREMQHSVAQALPGSHLCCSDYSEPTHGFMSPVQWTQTPCELQSPYCCLASTAHSAYASCSTGKDDLAPPYPSLPAHCIHSSVPGTWLSFPPTSFSRHTCMHMHVPPHTVLIGFRTDSSVLRFLIKSLTA